MADQDLNANYNSASKSSSGSGSPWDEDLDILTDEPKKPVAVIGSLEPGIPNEKVDTPVPFNVPEEVIEDKVGKKIPADQVMGKDVPKFYSANNEDKQPTKVDQNVKSDETKDVPVVPSVPIADDKSHEAPTILTQNNLDSAAISKNQNTTLLEQQEKNSSPLSNVPKPAESGITELIKDKNTPNDDMDALFEDPFSSPVAPISDLKQTQNKNNNTPTKLTENTNPTDTKLAESKQVQAPVQQTSQELKPAVQVQSVPKGNSEVDSLSQKNPDNIRVDEIVAPKQNETIQKTPEPMPQKAPATKKFSIFNRSKKANTPSNNPAPQIASNAQPPIMQGANSPAAPQAQAKKPSRPPFRLSPKISIAASLILLFVAATYLTEIGLLSIGLENAYGIVGAEKLWGGLPRSAESALGMAVVNQKDHLSFKYTGKVSVTVDKTKKSPVTTPLVSYGHEVIPKSDFGIALSQKAVLSQSSDYQDYYGNSSSSSSSSSDTSTSSDTSSTSSDTSSTSSSTADDDPYSSGNGSSSSDYVAEQSTVKQLDFDITGNSNDKSSSSSLTLKQLVGSNKQIELINSNGKIYVNSNDIKYDENAAKGKWLEYSLAKLTAENNISDLFNIGADSGLSIIGRRTGNEKIGDTRCFVYKIDSFEIGDSLSGIGLPQEAINSIVGTVWIGARDHLIHKVSLTIVPSISASLTNIQADITFFDYDISNDIAAPTLSNIVKPSTSTNGSGSSTGDGGTTPVTTPPITTTPPVVETSPSSTRVANDATRDQNLKTIKAALNTYKDQYGKYPTSSSFENISYSSSVLRKALYPSYLTTVPSDPKSSDGWWYGYKSDGKTFTLSARFENINDTEVTKVGSVYLHYVRN